MTADASANITRLLAIMARLRDPTSGCPWDKVQDFTSIAPYTIEEAYEVAQAIADRDMPALADELGDLLFQVIYHARLAEEQGAFSFADVAGLIADKMLRRHPHVFGEEEQREAAAHSASWEAQKSAERKARGQRGALAGVPTALPALTRAEKLTKRAAQVGFDWPSVKEVLEKLREETEELKAELDHADRARLQDELGDMLFVMANLARKLDLDPETCLRGANEKFTRRFEGVEKILAQKGLAPQDATLEMMEEAWVQVKKG